jgi:hypothetical protein
MKKKKGERSICMKKLCENNGKEVEYKEKMKVEEKINK